MQAQESHQESHRQPLLDDASRNGGAAGITSGGFWFVVMFVFAPVPLDSFALAVDVKSFASRCFPKCPPYLSSVSKICIYFIVIATHLNLYTWFGAVFSTGVVLCSRPFTQPHLRTLAIFLMVGHCILIVRALGRIFFGMKLRGSKGIRPEDLASRELAVDIAFWNPIMASWSAGTLWALLKGKAVAELRANSNSTDETINFAIAALYFAIYAWLMDIILRMAWIMIMSSLNNDFKACLTYRLLFQIPDVNLVTECPICLNQTVTDACKMHCGHVFHRACLTQWARTIYDGQELSCPMCRSVPKLLASLSDFSLDSHSP
eukprot:gnl/MRDRNA2_/MRDRNA2_153529_c0_seq1.p1 gnl/MRDRNA2_/MRDRNA2_153529_c0~~gnl/MRDRNA2_/MRDRNA2_153529_c0_seq1.p1  ORF type:complete len:319 (-),score=32.57 gnl/MRDRNA2_/MRDRNA2_153529_c0_seq1:303-1259(-)